MQKKHIIILGGYPGSGKSTVRGILAEKLGFKKFSTGDFARSIAVEMGMTLEQFNEMVAKTKEFDERIDAELIRIEKEEDNYIVDSHLAFHFIPSGFSVYLDISLETSALRVFNDKHAHVRVQSGDTMETLEEAMEKTKKRILNHEERYLRHYGVDPYISSQYSHIIDSEKYNQEEIADQIIEAYTAWISK
jgi:predicted cytidylate kinase